MDAGGNKAALLSILCLARERGENFGGLHDKGYY